jgi:hypothetical protein
MKFGPEVGNAREVRDREQPRPRSPCAVCSARSEAISDARGALNRRESVRGDDAVDVGRVYRRSPVIRSRSAPVGPRSATIAWIPRCPAEKEKIPLRRRRSLSNRRQENPAFSANRCKQSHLHENDTACFGIMNFTLSPTPRVGRLSGRGASQRKPNSGPENVGNQNRW